MEMRNISDLQLLLIFFGNIGLKPQTSDTLDHTS